MSDLNSVYMCEYFQSELQTVAQVGPGQWQVTAEGFCRSWGGGFSSNLTFFFHHTRFFFLLIRNLSEDFHL